ncbi:apextrin [Elysia marginata]|uniref:Apextrin n=1 Tax=Elysia marginata TaxID=1093978 RepID=A0AAV4JIN2_9GAST|nr:apextrin [Elysia marginata]
MFGWIVQALAVLLFTSYACSGAKAQQVTSSSASVTPFRLTYTPTRVVAHVTRDVTVRCEYDSLSQTRLEKVNWVRMLKESSGRWQLVAEVRDVDTTPRKMLNVTASGRIGQDVRNTFLEVTWDVASEETYGTYKCEAIGFDKDTHGFAVELTSQVVIANENMTATDILDLLRNLERDVADIKDKTKEYEEFMSSFGGNYADLNSGHTGVAYIRNEIDTLHHEIDCVVANVSSLTGTVESVISNNSTFATGAVISLNTDVRQLKEKVKHLDRIVISLNKTSESLAKDVSDNKKDLSSIDKQIGALENIVHSLSEQVRSYQKKFENLSEEVSQLNERCAAVANASSSDLSTNVLNDFSKQHAWPRGKFALPRPSAGCPADLTFVGKGDMSLTSPFQNGGRTNYYYCESSGAIERKDYWPQGSYCINKVFDSACPSGFASGRLNFSYADVKVYNRMGEYVSSVLEFCCRSSGSASANTPMVLPTESIFMLYRRGGQCQPVQGMSVKTYTRMIVRVPPTCDPDVSVSSGAIPDVRYSTDCPMQLVVCHYKKL